MSILGIRALGTLTSVFVMLASNAFAQDTTPNDTQSAGDSDEIIVTAQRREQALSEIGMSINAFSGEQLLDLGVNTTSDLARVVTGLNVLPPGTGVSGAPVYTLRGIGYNEKSLSALSAVAFYNDEVSVPYVWMTAGPTLDLQRVEVLKGPQGTLYGQNSTGGAINFIANRPTDTFEAGVEAGYGSYDHVDLNGFVSGPLSPELAGRLALRVISQDGWQSSASRPDDHLGSIASFAGRALLDWTPTDTLSVQFSLNGWLDRSEAPGAQMLGFNPAVPQVVVQGFYPYYDAYVTNALIGVDDAEIAEWTPGLDYTNDNSFTQASVRVDWDLSDAVRLTSISAATWFEYDTFHDVDASPAIFHHAGGVGDATVLSQELRLSGNAWDRLQWITGLNVSNDQVYDTNPTDPLQNTLGFATGLAGANTFSDTDRDTWAVFANADYNLLDTLVLTGGVRYTSTEVDFEGCTFDTGDGTLSALFTGGLVPPGGCVVFLDQTGPGFGVVRKNSQEDNVAWRIGLNWMPTDGQLFYANVARGYKSGNYPTLAGSLESLYSAVRQEEVTTYEIGFKSSFIDNRLQLTGAVFHSDYVDKHLYAFVFNTIIQSAAEQIVNVPESEVNGAELELIARPFDGLTMRGGVGYTDSEVLQAPTGVLGGNTSLTWPPAPGFVSASPADLTGLPFNLSPEWTANADIEYRWAASNALEAFVGVSALHSSSTSPTIGASPNQDLPEYTTVDLRTGVESVDGWRLMVWGRNVTDEFYLNAVQRGFDITARYPAMPTTWGVTLGIDFN